MNTKKELQWWIEFGQKDLKKIKQKTRDRLEVELTKKMLAYTSFWIEPSPDKKEARFFSGDEYIDFTVDYDLEEYKEATGAVVDQLKKTLARDSNDTDFIGYRIVTPTTEVAYASFAWEKDGLFRSRLVCRRPDVNTIVNFFISILMDGTRREDYKYCPYCGNLFLQVSMKKKYCTQYCSINASRRKKDG